MWVDSVSDALYSTGMFAIFSAADCRDKSEVPIRTRIGVELIPPWKQAFAWTVIRRSLQSVPAIHNRTKTLWMGNLQGMVRLVLDYYIKKKSQGVQTPGRSCGCSVGRLPKFKTKFNKTG